VPGSMKEQGTRPGARPQLGPAHLTTIYLNVLARLLELPTPELSINSAPSGRIVRAAGTSGDGELIVIMTIEFVGGSVWVRLERTFESQSPQSELRERGGRILARQLRDLLVAPERR